MRLFLASDIHMDLPRLKQLIARTGGATDLTICAGDLTNYGGRADTQAVITALSAPLLVIPGNLDTPDGLAYLIEEGLSIHAASQTVHDWTFIGFGGGSPEFVGDLLFTDAELTAAMEPLLQQADMSRTMFVTHQPPHNSALDKVFQLVPRGSPAVRTLIERYQPAYQICGHVHESWGEDRIGVTRCFNIAAVKEGRAATLDLATGTFTRLILE